MVLGLQAYFYVFLSFLRFFENPKSRDFLRFFAVFRSFLELCNAPQRLVIEMLPIYSSGAVAKTTIEVNSLQRISQSYLLEKS